MTDGLERVQAAINVEVILSMLREDGMSRKVTAFNPIDPVQFCEGCGRWSLPFSDQGPRLWPIDYHGDGGRSIARIDQMDTRYHACWT